MSMYMLNQIRTETEILASKVDHSAAKSDQDFLQKFDFADRYRKIGR
jgi:hypothetical protein